MFGEQADCILRSSLGGGAKWVLLTRSGDDRAQWVFCGHFRGEVRGHVTSLVLNFSSIGLMNSTALVRPHLARVPQDAAGLSPGGGCSWSATVQDREKVPLRSDWRWSTTFGNEKSDFKAQYFYFCCLSPHRWLKKGNEPVVQPEGWFGWWDKCCNGVSVRRRVGNYSWLLLP